MVLRKTSIDSEHIAAELLSMSVQVSKLPVLIIAGLDAFKPQSHRNIEALGPADLSRSGTATKHAVPEAPRG